MSEDWPVILRFVHLLGMGVWAAGTLSQMVVPLPLRAGELAELRFGIATLVRLQSILAVPGLVLVVGSAIGLVVASGGSLATLSAAQAMKAVLTCLGAIGTLGASAAMSRSQVVLEGFRENLGWVKTVARLVIGWRAGVSVTAAALAGGLILSTLK